MQTARPTASFQPSLISSFQCGAYSSQAVGTPYTISGPTSSCRMESSVAPQPPVTQSFRPPVVRQQDSTSASRSAETYVRQPVGTTTRAQPVGITVKVDDGAGKPVIAQQQNSSAPRRAEPSVTQTFSTVRAKVVEVQDGSKPAVVRQQDSSSASRSAEPYVRQPVGTTTRAQPVGITVKVDDGGMPVIASQEESSASRDAEPSVTQAFVTVRAKVVEVQGGSKPAVVRQEDSVPKDAEPYVRQPVGTTTRAQPVGITVKVDDGGMPVIASQEESSASRDAEPSVTQAFGTMRAKVVEVQGGSKPAVVRQEDSVPKDAEPYVRQPVGTTTSAQPVGITVKVDDGAGKPVIASQEESSASRDAEPSVTQDVSTMRAKVVEVDDGGKPVIVRQQDPSAPGGVRTIITSEDGTCSAFGEAIVTSLLSQGSTNEVMAWISRMGARSLRGLVNELSERFFEIQQNLCDRKAQLEEKRRVRGLSMFNLDENDCTEKDLDVAYRRLARTMHPDKNGGTEEAKEKFQTMRASYEELKEQFELGQIGKTSPKAAPGGSDSVETETPTAPEDTVESETPKDDVAGDVEKEDQADAASPKANNDEGGPSNKPSGKPSGQEIFYCRSEDLQILQGAVCKLLEKMKILKQNVAMVERDLAGV